MNMTVIRVTVGATVMMSWEQNLRLINEGSEQRSGPAVKWISPAVPDNIDSLLLLIVGESGKKPCRNV